MILDATWRDIKARTWANELANAWNMRVQIIEVTTEDESIVKERALTRKGDASSATFASYKRSKASAHPITQPHIVLKNESTLEALLQRVRRIAVNLLPKTATDTV